MVAPACFSETSRVRAEAVRTVFREIFPSRSYASTIAGGWGRTVTTPIAEKRMNLAAPAASPIDAVRGYESGNAVTIEHQHLRSLYSNIAGELLQVEAILRRELDSPHDLLRPLLMYGTQLGGKRLRPALLLLAGNLCGEITNEHLTLAAAIELVHTATLVHDDVLDDAKSRRHSPTINHRYDRQTSILLGDYLFAQSFRLAATLSSTRGCQLIGEASRKVCEGELRQTMLCGDLALSESTYFQLLDAKTAELCRVACQLGAEYAQASEPEIRALEGYGRALGMAFQIADDYLDLWGDDHVIGKTLGTDLIQGKLTLPIIHLLSNVSARDRVSIVSILEGPAAERFALLRPWIDTSDARSYTHSVATNFQRQAIDFIRPLAESSTKDALVGLAKLAVARRI